MAAAGWREGAAAPVLALALLLSACGGGSGGTSGEDGSRVVVTHSILGDIVENAVGAEVEVEVVMPIGSDPHDFEPSARQATSLHDADAVIANGAGFEEGLLDAVAAARDAGVPVLESAEAVDALESEEGGDDPHWFSDPDRAAAVAEAVGDFVAEEVDGVDAGAVRSTASNHAGRLRSLGRDLEERLAAVPPGGRKLVTNHEVFAYFADRFDFDVVGVVIPGGGTTSEPSAAALEDLAELIDAEDVHAVFGEVDQPAELAERLADEGGQDVAVVELFTESLGGPGSGAERYVDLLRTNAERIVDALTARA